MHDNHDLVETLLKGSTPAERDHCLEIIRLAYVFEPPEEEATHGAGRPRFSPSKPTVRHRA